MSLTFPNILLEMKNTNRNVVLSWFKILEYPKALKRFALNNITNGSIRIELFYTAIMVANEI